jgi:hypothetical protein
VNRAGRAVALSFEEIAMRMAFGLVSLLVVSGIVIYLMAIQAEKATTTGQQAKRDLGGITGRAPEDATTGNAGTTGNTGGATPNTAAKTGTTGTVNNSAPPVAGATSTPPPNRAGARTPVASITNREVRDIDKSAEFAVKPKGLLATSVFAGGYFDYFYGLQNGDLITDAGEVSLEGQDVAMLWEMAQKKRDLTVIRNGQKQVLQQRQ